MWGDFTNCIIGGFPLVKGKYNQTAYYSILQPHTIPSGMWFMGQGFVLMQDNYSNHTSKLYLSKEEQNVLQLMSWPAQTADLNSIEVVWDELD